MTQWGLDTLFNPAKRHMDEEKRRLQSTREEVGDTSGGKRIDFESGRVVIRRAGGDEDPAGDDPVESGDVSSEAGEAAASPDGETGRPAQRRERPEPSPAAIRAARRRGREPR